MRRAQASTRFDECQIVHAFLRDRVHQGVLFDVGAHRGSVSALFANDGWSVHAFEPDAANAMRFLENLEGRSNIRLDRRAVSDKSGDVLPFFTSKKSTGISSLHVFDSSHEQTGSVTTVSLRDYVNEHRLLKIDFLKTDIEGHDLFALRGLDFQTVRPKVIVSEYEEKKTRPLGISNSDIARFFSDRGYFFVVSEWHPVRAYGATHKWHRLTDSFGQVDPASWGNIIAFASEDLYDDFNRFVRQPNMLPRKMFAGRN
jgi:FkbM family methyltransferase